MTQRLYYTDPYLRNFDATIAAVDRRDATLIVTLDRTAFYPTSGGQPFDTGTLGGLPVVDVVDDDGTVTHVVQEVRRPGPSGPGRSADPADLTALQVGHTVHGVIDWPRRFDHMQQHTGQHVLSAAFDRLFHVRTVSFHLGATASTIDLARELTARDIDAAETEANRIAWEDVPGAITFADAEAAAKDQRHALSGLQNELARYRADELAASAEPTDGARLVLRAIDADANGLKALAMALATKPGYVAVLLSTAPPVLVVVARAPDVSVQANAIVSALTTRFGGRGGGKPE